MATAFSVTPAQATSASSSMSPEQSSAPVAAGRGVEARDGQRAPRLDLAGDLRLVDVAFGLERDERGGGVLLVALLERRLEGAQGVGIHGEAV